MEQYTYTILLQRSGQDSDQTESAFFTELHSALNTELESEMSESRKNALDTIQKSGASLRGGLAQFLSTPLKSDKDEIELLIRENLENVVKQMGRGKALSSIRQFSFRIIEPQQVPLHRQLVGVVRRILKNGKSLLVNTGIATGKNSGSLYLSEFLFDDLTIAPIIKTKFDSLKSKKDDLVFSMASDSLSSNILSIGYDNSATSHEILINFDAPDTIAERLHTRRATLLEQFGIKNMRLSKRTFLMGFASQFQLQIGLDINKHPLGSVIMSLVGDDDELEDVITSQGSLVVLEKV